MLTVYSLLNSETADLCYIVTYPFCRFISVIYFPVFLLSLMLLCFRHSFIIHCICFLPSCAFLSLSSFTAHTSTFKSDYITFFAVNTCCIYMTWYISFCWIHIFLFIFLLDIFLFISAYDDSSSFLTDLSYMSCLCSKDTTLHMLVDLS